MLAFVKTGLCAMYRDNHLSSRLRYFRVESFSSLRRMELKLQEIMAVGGGIGQCGACGGRGSGRLLLKCT